MGYGLESPWLADANVTSTLESHRNFKPYPASAKSLALPLVRQGSTRGSSTSVGGWHADLRSE